MKNSRLISTTGGGGIRTSRDGLASPVLLIMFVVFAIIFLLLANVLGKIGLGESATYGMVIAIPVAVFLVAGYITRTLGPGSAQAPGEIGGLAQFQNAGGNVGARSNALAGASEWFSLVFIVGMIATFSSADHEGIALMSGVFLGLAFFTAFIIPGLRHQMPMSFANMVCSQVVSGSYGRAALRISISLVVILCALAFLVAQIGAGARIIQLHFPMPAYWAGFVLLAPVMITMLVGGMRGLTLSNILLYFVIGAAIILPAIWLSMSITGNPVPQLAYGTGAFQPMLQLEQQLFTTVAEQLNSGIAQGDFGRISGISDFVTTVLVMMAGTAALPLVYERINCTTGVPTRTRSLGWTLILVALVFSVIPALVIFMKFEFYRNLIGLPVSQLGEGIEWLMRWAAFDGGRHALVCGSPAVDIKSIIIACGNSPDYVLLPDDIKFSSLMTLLASGKIADMPSVFSAITYAGVLSASATTAGIALMVIVNSVSSDLIFSPGSASEVKNSQGTLVPIARHLFVLRLLLLFTGGASIWLAQTMPEGASDYSLWSFTLAAGVIFPVFLLAIWWKPTTPLGALAGLAAGFIITAYLLITIEYGPDWIAGNGDEAVWLIGGERLKSSNAGIAGIPVAFAMAIGVSLIEKLIASLRKKYRKVPE